MFYKLLVAVFVSSVVFFNVVTGVSADGPKHLANKDNLQLGYGWNHQTMSTGPINCPVYNDNSHYWSDHSYIVKSDYQTVSHSAYVYNRNFTAKNKFFDCLDYGYMLMGKHATSKVITGNLLSGNYIGKVYTNIVMDRYESYVEFLIIVHYENQLHIILYTDYIESTNHSHILGNIGEQIVISLTAIELAQN